MKLRRAALLLAALALAAPAGAQRVAGELVEPESGAPVPAARVVLEAAGGRAVNSVLTDGAGRFVLRAPAAGEYRLRAERIGFAVTRSEPLRLEEGAEATHRMVAAGARVMLAAITVSTRTRCAPRPGAGAETAAVWEEVRKALTGVQETGADRSRWYTVELYERDVDPRSGEVLAESRTRKEGWYEKPFVPIDPERLAEVGFVERDGELILFSGPDADVILGDRFLEDHCFQLRTAGAPSPGLIGLAFEPVRGRRVPDVRGVLWVDRASAELRLLEFEYTRSPLRGPRGVPGGSVEFIRLPDGRWLTAAWQIRMPLEMVRAARGEPELVAIREFGGTLSPEAVPDER